MSINRQTTVWCDGEDCVAWEQVSGNAANARKTTRYLGWKHTRDGRDLCPRCVEAAKEGV